MAGQCKAINTENGLRCELAYGHDGQHEAEAIITWGIPGAPGFSWDV